jgi:hypothetical protein
MRKCACHWNNELDAQVAINRVDDAGEDMHSALPTIASLRRRAADRRLVRRTGWWRYLKTATPACQSVADVKVAVAF